MTNERDPTAPMLSCTTLVGDDVVDTDGEMLGRLDDLLIDTADGRVEYAVVACDGLLGIGESKHVVPMGALLLDADARRFVLRTSREHLADAPTLASGGLPDTADDDARDAYHAHWSRVPLLPTAARTRLRATDWRGPRPVLFPGPRM